MSPAKLIYVDILLETSDDCRFVVLHDELIQVVVFVVVVIFVATSLMSRQA
jgi:hypothetical protein